ncbi:MAG: hypothetical protein OEZ19_04340 [Paracoccaceae bacterium]|nr:hypothetical protein [Paracoccaceae bacterium]
MSTYDIEARVAALEAETAALKTHLKTAVVLLAAKGSSPFKSPLERFFDGPDGGLFEDPNKNFRCHVKCAKEFDAMMDAAGNDENARNAALEALASCHRVCDGGPA